MSSLIKNDHEIKLYIFGDGEQKKELLKLILDLNLENNIKLFHLHKIFITTFINLKVLFYLLYGKIPVLY